jgi:hypothetical protein
MLIIFRFAVRLQHLHMLPVPPRMRYTCPRGWLVKMMMMMIMTKFHYHHHLPQHEGSERMHMALVMLLAKHP